MEQRTLTKEKRAAESQVRKQKRQKKGKAADTARAIKRSPAGKKSAEALKEKRGIASKKEQANYQRTHARASARMGGRRKQILAEFQDQVEK